MFLFMMLSCLGVYVCVCVLGSKANLRHCSSGSPLPCFLRQDLMLRNLELLPLSPEQRMTSMSFLAFYVGAGA